MSNKAATFPAEVFGYAIWDHSAEAQQARMRHWCPFVDEPCNKQSRLIDMPFGVCSVHHHEQISAICPRRFEEPGTIAGVSRVLEEIARHYFGDLSNVIHFAEVRLPRVGSIDFVLVKHKPLLPEVDDFVMVEFQTDSTTSTGHLVRGFQDCLAGADVERGHYPSGMNTYDSIKRAITQLLNKGIVYEAWEVKVYWVIQEYIYGNLVQRYGFKHDRYDAAQASRFALYDLRRSGNRIALCSTRMISTSVDEIYRAMRANPNMPAKDDFIERLILQRKVARR